MRFAQAFLSSNLPAARLLRQVLLFCAVDVAFVGFAMAYAFAHHGLEGVLLYFAAQYLASAAGFIGCFVLMQSPRRTPTKLFRSGVAVMLLGMALASVTPTVLAGLSFLALAGAGRGMAWAARQWLEIHHTKREARESYLALLQTGGTLFKLMGQLGAATLMFASGDDFQMLFATVAVLGFGAWAALRDPDELATPVPGPARPLRTLRDPIFWKTAPFYAVEGAGTALRQALFVSGTLAVVGSVSGYAVVDALSSLAAAGVLAFLASRPEVAPSLQRLQLSVVLVGLSWLLLLGALELPFLLAAFVALQAFGMPLLATVKSGLVLKGLSSPGAAPHDSAMARELLLVSARLLSLVLAAALAHSVLTPTAALSLVVGLMLLLLPLEYILSRELAQRKET